MSSQLIIRILAIKYLLIIGFVTPGNCRNIETIKDETNNYDDTFLEAVANKFNPYQTSHELALNPSFAPVEIDGNIDLLQENESKLNMLPQNRANLVELIKSLVPRKPLQNREEKSFNIEPCSSGVLCDEKLSLPDEKLIQAWLSETNVDEMLFSNDSPIHYNNLHPNEKNMCDATYSFMFPLKGFNTTTKVWELIINIPKYRQRVTIESCGRAGLHCSSINGLKLEDTFCKQKYANRLLVVMDETRAVYQSLYSIKSCCQCYRKTNNYFDSRV